MSTPFLLLIMADCEATQHSLRDPALGERSVRGLLELASQEAVHLTLFATPGDLAASPALYREAAGRNHEVGLHLHPSDLGYTEFLGVCSCQEQRRIFSDAVERFTGVMNAPPKAFSPGYYSANDYTLPLLAELGFTHGCVSAPGRVLPECASVWAGAPLDAHYANPNNRLLAGGLDFVNFPATVDPDSRMWGGKHPQDLRVELVDAKNHWYTIAKAVKRQLDNPPAVSSIRITTHNTFEYGDVRDFRRQTLLKMIEHTRKIVSDAGAGLLPVTAEQAAALFRRAAPPNQAAPLHLDIRGRI
jgi:peptidoglycan/xylan/chitin deacetylase (PgdA/CDA1 family)